MKKSIATLIVAILALGSVSAFAALDFDSSAATVKKEVTAAMKKANSDSAAMTEIKTLLENLSNASEKQQTVILNAIKTALNTATLKKYADAAVNQLKSDSVTITKAAGGKWNITLVVTDTTTGAVIKEDIPKAAVEKPTLSVDPTVNAR